MAERIYRRRVDPSQVISIELATFVCQVSRETGRQVGVMLNRRGHPEHVVIGTASKLWLPDIGRLRGGRGRLGTGQYGESQPADSLHGSRD